MLAILVKYNTSYINFYKDLFKQINIKYEIIDSHFTEGFTHDVKHILYTKFLYKNINEICFIDTKYKVDKKYFIDRIENLYITNNLQKIFYYYIKSVSYQTILNNHDRFQKNVFLCG